MLRTYAIVAITLLCISCVAHAADAPKKTEIQGTWKLDISQNSELKGDQDKPNDVTVVYEADSWKMTIINEGGTQEIVGGYFCDPAQTPKVLDVTIRGDAETTDLYAIYEVIVDKLTVAWRADGTRPPDFNGTLADGLVKVSFLRVKED